MALRSLLDSTYTVGLLCIFFTLTGCGAGLVTSMSPEQKNPDYFFEQTFKYPPKIVYSNLLKVVERNDRKIIIVEEQSLTVLIHWPFGFFQNRWGGKALIKCEPYDNGTIVRIGVYSERDRVTVSYKEFDKQIYQDLAESLATP